MLVDLTAQLDKTNKLLRQLLEAKHHTKSEQLSPDQLRLFREELKRANKDSKDDDPPPPDARSGAGQAETKPDSRPRGRQPLPPHLKRQRIERFQPEQKHCSAKSRAGAKAAIHSNTPNPVTLIKMEPSHDVLSAMVRCCWVARRWSVRALSYSRGTASAVRL